MDCDRKIQGHRCAESEGSTVSGSGRIPPHADPPTPRPIPPRAFRGRPWRGGLGKSGFARGRRRHGLRVVRMGLTAGHVGPAYAIVMPRAASFPGSWFRVRPRAISNQPPTARNGVGRAHAPGGPCRGGLGKSGFARGRRRDGFRVVRMGLTAGHVGPAYATRDARIRGPGFFGCVGFGCVPPHAQRTVNSAPQATPLHEETLLPRAH
jgi:hypothetical protein